MSGHPKFGTEKQWSKLNMLPAFFPIRFGKNDRLKILNNLKEYHNDTFTIWCSRNGISIEKRNGWLIKNVELEYNPLDSDELIVVEVTRDELEHMIQDPNCSLMIVPSLYPDEEITYAIPLFSTNKENLH